MLPSVCHPESLHEHQLAHQHHLVHPESGLDLLRRVVWGAQTKIDRLVASCENRTGLLSLHGDASPLRHPHSTPRSSSFSSITLPRSNCAI